MNTGKIYKWDKKHKHNIFDKKVVKSISTQDLLSLCQQTKDELVNHTIYLKIPKTGKERIEKRKALNRRYEMSLYKRLFFLLAESKERGMDVIYPIYKYREHDIVYEYNLNFFEKSIDIFTICGLGRCANGFPEALQKTDFMFEKYGGQDA